MPDRAARGFVPSLGNTPMTETFKNFIAGEWVAPATGDHFENRNPADWNDVIGRFPRSGAEDLDRAIASAKRGFAQWSKTPAPIRGQVLLLVEVLLEAGLPPEVVQLVHGQGSVVGRALVEHRDVPVISFTGSTETGSSIGATCGKMHKRLSLEMGGKNAMMVMDDADLDLALDGVLWGAFGTTGQRCTATSRLILHEKIHDKFLQMLTARAGKLRLGPGLDEKTDVGPLIHEEARQKVAAYVDIAKKEGASVAIGGRIPQGDKRLECGWFYEPTVLTGVKPGMRVEQEEIFGPVLDVLKVKDLAEAISVTNGVKYGLSSSLYTRDINAAFRAMTDLDTGITYVNAPTIGAEAHLPFGGVKQTGNGHREGGWEVYDFYSETKVVYVDFSGKLQRAQIDTEV